MPLSGAQKAKLKAKAQAAGPSLANYIRQCCGLPLVRQGERKDLFLTKAEAEAMTTGDLVYYKGRIRRVFSVSRRGPCAPYLRLEDVTAGPISYRLCFTPRRSKQTKRSDSQEYSDNSHLWNQTLIFTTNRQTPPTEGHLLPETSSDFV